MLNTIKIVHKDVKAWNFAQNGSLEAKNGFKSQTQKIGTCLCILQTRTGFQAKIWNFFLQSVSCYIPLESIFHADSEKHHNLYLKMKQLKVIAVRCLKNDVIADVS